MSKRSVSLLIDDILESVDKIERYTEGMNQESFQSDEKTTDAVFRNLEIIGEKGVPLWQKKFLNVDSPLSSALMLSNTVASWVKTKRPLYKH